MLIRRKNIVSLVCVLSGVFMLVSTALCAEKAAGSGKQARPAVPVSAITLKKEPVQTTAELPGRTAAHRVAEIRPQVTGIITKRFFVEGSQVKKGQQLYQIDPATYQAQYEAKKAALQKAQANLRSTQAKDSRYTELVKIDAISKQDYDDTHAALIQAEADIAVAKADMKTAKIDLDYTRVYAPISGQISESTVTEGALVIANQQTSLATITQLDPIYVDMQESARNLMRLKNQSRNDGKVEVTLMTDMFGEYPYKGELQFSDVTVNPTTGSVKLRALFPNPDKQLLPGLFVRGTLHLAQHEALLVPHQAAQRNAQGQLSVWVISDMSTVSVQPIVVRGSYGHNWMVTDGLTEGMQIVTAGFQKIRPGAKVQVTPDQVAK